ncbi:MAG TPA: hypothetical protein VNX68_15660 [Nitrosopumilaceae archaeon]|jgi:hypothetical protein|nr:hypothetical protein [Nitrosopumilaceae archaeon]
MKKINIKDYRFSNIEKSKMIDFDTTSISSFLTDNGFEEKRAGLCAPPWDKYFSFSHQDSRGVTHSGGTPINVCHITVNQATSTYSKRKYYYSITIVKTAKKYYVTALAQTSRYKESIGADHVVYECEEEKLNLVIKKLFKDVKF